LLWCNLQKKILSKLFLSHPWLPSIFGPSGDWLVPLPVLCAVRALLVQALPALPRKIVCVFMPCLALLLA